MPRLLFQIDLTSPALDLAAHALSVVQDQEFARQNGISLEEREGTYHRDFVLTSLPKE